MDEFWHFVRLLIQKCWIAESGFIPALFFIYIGKGMMHCWGAMEFVPEARAVRQEYFKALR